MSPTALVGESALREQSDAPRERRDRRALRLTSLRPAPSLLSVLAEDLETEEHEEVHHRRPARVPEAYRHPPHNLHASDNVSCPLEEPARRVRQLPAGLKIVRTFLEYDDEQGEEGIGVQRQAKSEPPPSQQQRSRRRTHSAPGSPVVVSDADALAGEVRSSCKDTEAQRIQRAHRPSDRQMLLWRTGHGSVESRTTMHLKNLPCFFDQKMLKGMLKCRGFAGLYDFLHVPVDPRTHRSLGYGFINFCNSGTAQSFRSAFEGYANWPYPSNKVLDVVWSRTQGCAGNVKRVRGKQVPDALRPVFIPRHGSS